MDEKVIELLGKLLEGQTDLRTDIERLGGQMAQMESTFTDKIGALFDAHKDQQDVSERILERLERLETKVDDLQLETAHVRLIK